MTRHNPASRLPAIPQTDLDLIAEYLVSEEAADATWVKRRAHLIEFATWLTHERTTHPRGEGPCEIDRASNGQVHLFMSYLISGDRYAGPPRSLGAPLAASSRKGFLATLRSFYKHLLIVRVVTHDPTLGVRAPKVKVQPGFRLSADELHRLLATSGTQRDRMQTYLLVYTAARAGELRRLTWDDIDFHRRTIVLHGKGDTTHVVNIHSVLMVELRRWLILQEQLALHHPLMQAARQLPSTNFVLMTTNGRPLAATAIYKQLKRRATRAGLYVLDPAHRECRSLVSPHAIRRSVATLLLNDGEPLDAVSDLLHHRQVDTTRTHYAFSSPERRRATIEAILR